MEAETKQIQTFLHCARCTRENPGMPPKKWARLEVGFTRRGLQVWCLRHDMEVAHFTPEKIVEFLARGPLCACCPGGMHRS
jgi:hypothetical protein